MVFAVHKNNIYPVALSVGGENGYGFTVHEIVAVLPCGDYPEKQDGQQDDIFKYEKNCPSAPLCFRHFNVKKCSYSVHFHSSLAIAANAFPISSPL